MRIKRALSVIIITLSFTMLMGCNRATKSTDDSMVQLAEWARQEGYNQAYLEMSYNMGNGVLEVDYNNYLEAKKQYETDKNLDNFKVLVESTQKALKGVKN